MLSLLDYGTSFLDGNKRTSRKNSLISPNPPAFFITSNEYLQADGLSGPTGGAHWQDYEQWSALVDRHIGLGGVPSSILRLDIDDYGDEWKLLQHTITLHARDTTMG